MDLAKTLIRTVVRAFYDTRCALVVDSLFIHSVIHAEDLAYLMGMQPKDLRKVCGELKAAKLIASHSKSEIKEGSNRATSRDYYFIPFHPVIDCIKLRIYKLTSTIKAQYVPSSERKALHCPRCDASYTELEAMSNNGPEGLLVCERCRHVLENEDESKLEDQAGFEKQSRLMNQLEKLLQLLKQVDQNDIPANDFEDAWAVKVDVKRPEAPNRPQFPGQITHTVVRGAVGTTDASNLSISLATTEELTAAQEKEDAERKAEFLLKNEKPDWFKHSTVASISINRDGAIPSASSGTATAADVKRKLEDEDEGSKKAVEASAMDAELKAYYAEMAREKEREAKENASSTDDEDDDEDGFVDVNVSTPASVPPPRVPTTNGMPLSALKVDESESASSSAPATSTATPADSSTLADGPRPAKRVKIEDFASTSNDKIKGIGQPDEFEDDEDSGDFVDVPKPKVTGIGAGGPVQAPRGTGDKAEEEEDSDEDEADFEDVSGAA